MKQLEFVLQSEEVFSLFFLDLSICELKWVDVDHGRFAQLQLVNTKKREYRFIFPITISIDGRLGRAVMTWHSRLEPIKTLNRLREKHNELVLWSNINKRKHFSFCFCIKFCRFYFSSFRFFPFYYFYVGQIDINVQRHCSNHRDSFSRAPTCVSSCWTFGRFTI